LRRRRARDLRVASFFAGIGGFDLGFERAGLDTVWQCEIDPFCLEILDHQWSDVPKAFDIREVDPEDIPDADVWAGGFPCQDVSIARMGPRSGLRGTQSRLFFEYARLVAARRPPVVLIENVPGLLSSHRGRDFGIILATLDKFGYGVAWRMLDSRYFGVPQSRKRVFIVGCHRDGQRAAEILFEPQRSERYSQKSESNGTKPLSPFKEVLRDPRSGATVKGIAHCLYAESARHTGTDWSRNYVSYPDGRVRRLLPVECERLQGFPDNWTLPRGKVSDPDRIDSLRYHAVGNAVTVPVAQWLGTRLVASQKLLSNTTELKAARS